jgi:hydrogenase/urease accessory protein HupE
MNVIDRWWLWVLFNLIGIALFLYLAVQTWVEPELAHEPAASGDASIAWGITALPILLLFLLSHFAVGFVSDHQRQRTGSWRGEIFVGVTLLCWIAVFLCDRAHHGF